MELISFLMLFIIFISLSFFNVIGKSRVFGIFSGLFLIFLALGVLNTGIQYKVGETNSATETIDGNTTTIERNITYVYQDIPTPSYFPGNWSNVLGMFFLGLSVFLIGYNMLYLIESR